MLSDLANRLVTLRRFSNAERLPSVIFGSSNALAANLDQKTPLRIAMFPALSQSNPQLAMGVMTCLAYLLENYQDITVYRQFVRLDETSSPDDYHWSIEEAQFSFEDWQLELLDDNSAVWGTLEQASNGLTFTLEVESDLLEDSTSSFKQSYTSVSLIELAGLLPKVARDIAVYLKADSNRVRLLKPYNVSEVSDEAQIIPLLIKIFEFEVHVFLHLWGQEQNLFAEWMTLRESAPDAALSAWLLSSALGRLLLPGMGPRDQLQNNDELATFFDQHPAALANLARSISTHDWQAAVRLLESRINDEGSENQDAELYFTLADLELQSGQLNSAVEHYQRAALLAPDDPTAQLRRAQVLSVADDRSVATRGERFYADESLQAYDLALQFGVANQAQILMSQLLLMLKHPQRDELSDMILSKFDALVDKDDSGEFVLDAVEELYNFDEIDFDQVFEILQAAAENTPDRVDRQINLAGAHLVAEAFDNANDVLEAALSNAVLPDHIAEIQRLMLYADDPDFESIMGEIIDKVGSKTPPDETEIDYLEQVIEAAPKYSEGYQLLFQSYQLWKDPNAAMETLLEGVKELPNDPDILVMLAQTLMADDQVELAIPYLERSAARNPLHVPSLAYLGKALFDNDQYEEARASMTRAERLSPRHPTLLEVRTYIAGRMAE